MRVYDFEVKTLDGSTTVLKEYQGKALLIVNTASKCGLAKQLNGLEELHNKYQSQGFEVLGFPCNQFIGQEPLEGVEIQKFCQGNYGTSFPLYGKLKVNGKEAHPLFKYLKEETGGGPVKWNYTKFLVDKNGQVVNRFAPTTAPKKLEKDIEKVL